jgi:hypothetical protein
MSIMRRQSATFSCDRASPAPGNPFTGGAGLVEIVSVGQAPPDGASRTLRHPAVSVAQPPYFRLINPAVTRGATAWHCVQRDWRRLEAVSRRARAVHRRRHRVVVIETIRARGRGSGWSSTPAAQRRSGRCATVRSSACRSGSTRRRRCKRRGESRRVRELGGLRQRLRQLREAATNKPLYEAKPSIGLEPMTPSLPWKCSTN